MVKVKLLSSVFGSYVCISVYWINRLSNQTVRTGIEIWEVYAQQW